MDELGKILNQLLLEVVPMIIGRIKKNEESSGAHFKSLGDNVLALTEAVQKLGERITALEAKPVTPGRKRRAKAEEPAKPAVGLDVTDSCDGDPDPDTIVHINYALWLARGSVDGVRQLLTGKPDVERNFCLYLKMSESDYQAVAGRSSIAVPAQYEGFFPHEEIRQS